MGSAPPSRVGPGSECTRDAPEKESAPVSRSSRTPATSFQAPGSGSRSRASSPPPRPTGGRHQPGRRGVAFSCSSSGFKSAGIAKEPPPGRTPSLPAPAATVQHEFARGAQPLGRSVRSLVHEMPRGGSGAPAAPSVPSPSPFHFHTARRRPPTNEGTFATFTRGPLMAGEMPGYVARVPPYPGTPPGEGARFRRTLRRMKLARGDRETVFHQCPYPSRFGGMIPSLMAPRRGACGKDPPWIAARARRRRCRAAGEK